jgi:hypothetical protein
MDEQQKTITCSFADPIAPEYRWFAWYPVQTMDAGRRWLTFVWKRKYCPHSWLPPMGTFFMYATKKGIMS